MTEPGPAATDAELADYYDQHRDLTAWSEPQPVQPERLDVTISVRFTPTEIAVIRSRAEAAGLKPTTYIRRCALVDDEHPPIDRGRLSQTVAALSRNVEDLRRAAG